VIRYDYAIAITSQFPFCSIPFRLDAYSSCQFSCRYCFAGARGGFTGDRRIQAANPDLLRRRFERVDCDSPGSVLDELITARVPLHFGGMSDPFMPLERDARVTLGLLRVLQKQSYPTIVSTKSDLCAEEPYRSVLSEGPFIVQFSLSTTNDHLARAIDAGAPPPARRLAALETLSRAGIRTACRIQPLLPGYENHAAHVVRSVADAGARHVAIEHLKVPIEKQAPTVRRLNSALGCDLAADYRAAGASRFGREWILPAARRLPRILEMRDLAWSLGLTFGAADNDFLPLSDGHSCCSGADLLGFSTTYRFTYTQAVHASDSGQVQFSNIAREWHPTKSIRRFVNSRSRGGGSSVDEYLRARWNGRRNGPSPAMFYGVQATNRRDRNGYIIYQLSTEAMKLRRARPQPVPQQLTPAIRKLV
jgi:DNA repair photolyase